MPLKKKALTVGAVEGLKNHSRDTEFINTNFQIQVPQNAQPIYVEGRIGGWLVLVPAGFVAYRADGKPCGIFTSLGAAALGMKASIVGGSNG